MQRRRSKALFAALCTALCFPVLSVGTAGARAKPHKQPPHLCVFDRMSLHSAPGTCRPQAIAYPPSVTGSVKRAIYDSAMTFGMPYHILLGIANCESSLDPHARNGQHYGLFQFLPSTFQEGLRDMRAMTGIQAYTFWNPRDASYVAGFLFAVGKDNRWACLSRVRHE